MGRQDLISKNRQDLAGRHILMLQGPSSRFFQYVATASHQLGADVTRLCFCPGDRLYWSRSIGPAIHFRGGLDDIPSFISDLVTRLGVTDVVMLGDGRAYHAAALEALKLKTSAQPWIVEHGYLRPGLILVENCGTGGRSSAPQLFAQGHDDAGPVLPEPAAPPRSGSFLRYALLDIGFHVTNLLASRITHPHYAHHALDGPIREYAGWMLKALQWPFRRKRTEGGMDRVRAHRGPVFFFPLQLATDFQIRHHGTGAPLPAIASAVIESFARTAPKDAALVFKEHPLDNGLHDWHRQLHYEAKRYDVADRIIFLPGGNLDELIQRSAGVVTVNSTVGLSAMIEGLPCHVLGRAVYDLPGLSDPKALDSFWTNPEPPDPALLQRYVTFLRSRFHIVGGFDGPAAYVGARNLALRLTQPPVDA